MIPKVFPFFIYIFIVLSNTVNVICELARKTPIEYLNWAPSLYKLLTSGSNNWMLIKIIKLNLLIQDTKPWCLDRTPSSLLHFVGQTKALHACQYQVWSTETSDSDNKLHIDFHNWLSLFIQILKEFLICYLPAKCNSLPI